MGNGRGDGLGDLLEMIVMTVDVQNLSSGSGSVDRGPSMHHSDPPGPNLKASNPMA